MTDAELLLEISKLKKKIALLPVGDEERLEYEIEHNELLEILEDDYAGF
jgi:hypothetical protein